MTTKRHDHRRDHIQATDQPRPPDRRELLWNERKHVHAQPGIDPPTAAYILEALAEDVALARRGCTSMPNPADRLKVDATVQHQAGAAVEDAFGKPTPDVHQEAAHHRRHPS